MFAPTQPLSSSIDIMSSGMIGGPVVSLPSIKPVVVTAAAAAIDFMSRLLNLETDGEARAQAAQMIVDFVGADFVAIGSTTSSSAPCSLANMVGPKQPPADRSDDLEAALGEAVTTGRVHVVNQAGTRSTAGLAHRRLARLLPADSSITTIPLMTDDGECTGAIVIAWSTGHDAVAVASHAEFLSIVTPLLAQWLLVLQRTTPTPWLQSWNHLRKAATRSRLKLAAGLLIAAMCVGMIPVRYPVLADVVVEPISRRVVVAPFSGLLKFVHVVPGQAVSVGQRLATIDVEETANKIEALRAELQRVQSERSTYLSASRLSDAAVSGWTAKRVESELALLMKHWEQSELLSPLDGVVLGEDLSRLVGCPLETGQLLMEIANTAAMQANVEVPSDQILNARVGHEASICLDAIGTVGNLRLTAIHPRAEPNEQGVYVFVARCELPAYDNRLRSGMRGTATIHGEPCPWAWSLFQRIWQRIRSWS